MDHHLLRYGASMFSLITQESLTSCTGVAVHIRGSSSLDVASCRQGCRQRSVDGVFSLSFGISSALPINAACVWCHTILGWLPMMLNLPLPLLLVEYMPV